MYKTSLLPDSVKKKKNNTFFDCLPQWNIINHCQPLSDFPSPNHGNHPNYFIEADSYDTQPCRSALLPCSAQAFQALCYCSTYQGVLILSAFTLLLACVCHSARTRLSHEDSQGAIHP